MNHRVFGRKLSRTHNERRRLFQGLSRDLFIHGHIQTTLAKAKAVQPIVERLITKSKRGATSDMIQIRKLLADKTSVNALMEQAKTRFTTRTSGYTRIYKLGMRTSDGAKEAYLTFVDPLVVAETVPSSAPVKSKSSPKDVKSVKAVPGPVKRTRAAKQSK